MPGGRQLKAQGDMPRYAGTPAATGTLQALHAHEAPAVSQNELSVGQVLRSLP